MFHEGETIIRQGDNHSTLGPYAQQVYMLDSGIVEVTALGAFEEMPPEPEVQIAGVDGEEADAEQDAVDEVGLYLYSCA